MASLWSNFGSIMMTLMFLRSLAKELIPPSFYDLCHEKMAELVGFLRPYVTIKIEESEGFRSSELYDAVQHYLSDKSSSLAKKLVLKKPKNSKDFSFAADKNERITDEFEGAKVWWILRSKTLKNAMVFWRTFDDKRHYELTFHRRHKTLVLEKYLPHIVSEAKVAEMKRRQRKIFTNTGGKSGFSDYGHSSKLWTPVPFQHPSTFETLALEPELKQEILRDLDKFKNAEKYYKKVGRAWKRGYLLFGPPGTGKSSMIAAMANYLDYDIYDLELTEVQSNTDLRKLLINTSNQSIIVIEDIDCSLDLSDRKKRAEEKKEEDDKTVEGEDPIAEKKKEEEKKKKEESKVTLAGVLNFTDGLWSCCGSERIFVFTTNHKERLDPALLRSGRMDKHIHLSYCGFGAFRVLAKNYLDIEDHSLFEVIKEVLAQAEMTPADLAEHLMRDSDDITSALSHLLAALRDKRDEKKRVQDEEEPREKLENSA